MASGRALVNAWTGNLHASIIPERLTVFPADATFTNNPVAGTNERQAVAGLDAVVVALAHGGHGQVGVGLNSPGNSCLYRPWWIRLAVVSRFRASTIHSDCVVPRSMASCWTGF